MTAFGVMRLSITILSIKTLSIKTLSIMIPKRHSV
jgi:hypothetical protein